MAESLKKEIFNTKSKIMMLEQEIFYMEEELKRLKFNLQNMEEIQDSQNEY